jgi:Beta-propeller repeat
MRVARWQRILTVGGFYATLGLAGCSLFTGGDREGATAGPGASRAASAPHAQRAGISSMFHMPRRFGFEPNRGHYPPELQFSIRDDAGALFLNRSSVVWNLHTPQAAGGPDAANQTNAVRMRWIGGSQNPQIAATDAAPGHINYINGNQPGAWRYDVPLYRHITYRNVYPGVDLIFHDRTDELEYDFVVSPAADPNVIKLDFPGGGRPALTADGDLVLRVGHTTLRHRAPRAYQEVNGRQHTVSARYAFDAHGNVGFEVGAYDRTRSLIVDPRIAYTTEIPVNLVDGVTDIAVDGNGNVWLTGITRMDSVPLTDDALDRTFALQEGFVIKLDALGHLVYATYLGGNSAFDVPGSIAVDRDGNAYIAGATASTDFPVTANAIQPALKTPEFKTFDAFLTKLSPSGQLLYSTYYGGSFNENLSGGSEGEPAAAVAVADDGSVYLAGTTGSDDFPVTTNAYQPAQTAFRSTDAYLVKFTKDFDIEYATYFGGSNNDNLYRLAVDGNGNPYLFGCTSRILNDTWSFPVTPGAFQTDSTTFDVNFVAKFDLSGALTYSTFLGQTSGKDGGCLNTRGGLAVDAAGNAYVVGVTSSDKFPTTPGAFQPQIKGNVDLFISKLDPTGAQLVYSTYFGGSQAEQQEGNAQGVRIAVNANGNAYVTSGTFSLDLPIKDPFDTTAGNFVAKLTADGSGLAYSSYIPLAAGPLAVGHDAVYLAGSHVSQPIIVAIKVDEAAAPCVGDCDGDGIVSIGELIRGINIALGNAAVDDCPSFDADGNGIVTVAELVLAVNNALNGCG